MVSLYAKGISNKDIKDHRQGIGRHRRMAEPALGTGLPYRLDGRHLLQGAHELQGDQRDPICCVGLRRDRKKESARPLARQERIDRFLDVRHYRYEGK